MMIGKKTAVALLIVAGALAVFFGYRYDRGQSIPEDSADRRDAGDRLVSPWQRQTDAQGSVTVDVRPIAVEEGKSIQFEVSLNTHTVELNEDLTLRVMLYDDQSRAYAPTSWEGVAPGGHHRSGTLTFAPLQRLPKSLELRMNDVGGVTARVFRWEVPGEWRIL